MCVPLLHACHSRALTLEMVARSRSRMCATVTVGRTLHALLCALVQSLCAAVMVRDKGSLWVRLALLNIMCYRRVSFVFVSRGPRRVYIKDCVTYITASYMMGPTTRVELCRILVQPKMRA